MMVVPMSATLSISLEKEQEICFYSCKHYSHVVPNILKSKYTKNLMKI